MVTLDSAQNALKSVYLGVLSEQLNIKSNAFLSKIKQSSKDVYGKEIIKLAPYGLNGGICASSETGTLPTASSHKFLQFKSGLKNLYGTISISDKAIRASMSDSGAFVNLLSDEMDSLVKSSAFNLGRMVYGDGTGLLATVTVADSKTTFNSVKNFVEGMKVDIYSSTGALAKSGLVVTYVDRTNKTITLSESYTFLNGDKIYACGSKDNEITGIKRLFDKTEANRMLYGVDRTNYAWLYPYVEENSKTAVEISDSLIQTALNSIEEETGSQVDFIAVSGDVRTAYQKYLSANRRNLDIEILAGGYKAMTYAGIPVVYERFVDDGTMYLLNTQDFNLHQLCDWEWLTTDNGSILIPSATSPTYTATLVKYAELICDRPGAQGKISNIKNS